MIKHMLIGIFLEMADKSCMISQFLEQQLLASDERVLNVYDHTNIPVLNLRDLVLIVRGRPTPDFGGNSIDHPSERLNGT